MSNARPGESAPRGDSHGGEAPRELTWSDWPAQRMRERAALATIIILGTIAWAMSFHPCTVY